MADFRIIILKSRVPPASTFIPAPALAPPVTFLAFIFTFARRWVLPKLFTYHGVKKEFQPWYFQVRAKLQVDFTHLSERNYFFLHPYLTEK